MLFRFLKIISYPVLLVFIAVNAFSLFRAGIDAAAHYRCFFGFGAGVVAYFFLRRLLRKNMDFFETFTHELAHTIVGLLFFQRIHSFEATNGSGGMMRHSGRYSRNVFIALAPYCLPVYTYVLLVFRLVIIPDFIPFFDVPVGVSFAFHAFAVKRDLSPRQTDIKDCGILFSYLFIAAFIFFNAAIIFRTISIGFAGAFSGWRNDFLFLFYKVSAGF